MELGQDEEAPGVFGMVRPFLFFQTRVNFFARGTASAYFWELESLSTLARRRLAFASWLPEAFFLSFSEDLLSPSFRFVFPGVFISAFALPKTSHFIFGATTTANIRIEAANRARMATEFRHIKAPSAWALRPGSRRKMPSGTASRIARSMRL